MATGIRHTAFRKSGPDPDSNVIQVSDSNTE